MQVKISDGVYDSADQPVMVVLEPHEKAEIAALDGQETMYCCYPAEMDADEVRAWMHGRQPENNGEEDGDE